MNRDFTAAYPGHEPVADITSIRTWQGWVPPDDGAGLRHEESHRTRHGRAYAHRPRSSTPRAWPSATAAPDQETTTPSTPDAGTQYTGEAFARFTQAHGITRSVGRTGICYDNARAESFNATLKNERVHRTTYPTRARAIADITKYIELRYHRKRLHPALGYRTPDEAENEWYATQPAA